MCSRNSRDMKREVGPRRILRSEPPLCFKEQRRLKTLVPALLIENLKNITPKGVDILVPYEDQVDRI